MALPVYGIGQHSRLYGPLEKLTARLGVSRKRKQVEEGRRRIGKGGLFYTVAVSMARENERTYFSANVFVTMPPAVEDTIQPRPMDEHERPKTRQEGWSPPAAHGFRVHMCAHLLASGSLSLSLTCTLVALFFFCILVKVLGGRAR